MKNESNISKRFSLVVVLAVLLLFCNLNSLVIADSENSWTTKLSMPTARCNFGVAVVGSKIYAIGGYKDGSGYLATNEEYDPATNTWTTKTPMPTPRSRFAIAVWQNKIYVIGGYYKDNLVNYYLGTNEVYDPSTDSWETLTAMPTARALLTADVVNDKIYLIGGNGESFDLNEVYDPKTDSWTTKAPLPTPVSSHCSAVVDDKIYILGGYARTERPDYCDLNQIYDPDTNTWDFGAKMPEQKSSAAAGATVGLAAPKRIYVIGGVTENTGSADAITNHNYAYDPERDEWTTGTPMPTIRNKLAIAVVNDVIYAMGGMTKDFVVTTKNEQYTPIGYGFLQPSPSPTPSPLPTNTPTPTPKPTPIPTPTPTSTPTPEPAVGLFLPIEAIIGIGAIFTTIIISLVVMLRRKK